ncbi:alpha-L-fucosidase 2-like [Glycine soja]|uniref:Alpha-L-fucosidase 2 n=3 Tax=Glycine soja TaxID=3848 RepID=A0A0B2RF03_GLYSO|nr:alpha-L-fucosidase 2-like [Glycine soja]KHN30427.1 Alpha-L-fucosidase 2 [Glycine soja]RZC31688.1 Alpha-L-fucosidase 2 isoform A [Glycine soja]
MAEGRGSRNLKIRFREGGKHWTDAVPIGNGRLGAMVCGHVHSETIHLNEDTLWTGTPADYTNSKAPPALSHVRNLVHRQHYPQATAASSALTGNPSEAYLLLGDIQLDFDYSHLTPGLQQPYERELDLDTATVKVRYSVGDVQFTREHFASYPDQLIVTQISSSKPAKLSFTVSLLSKIINQTYVNAPNQIIMKGSCPGKRIQHNPHGIQFSAILDLKIGGTDGVIHILDNNKLKVEASDWAVLLLVASSSFSGPFTAPSDSKKDPTSQCFTTLSSISNVSYSHLYARHLNDYQGLFHRVSLQLMRSTRPNISEDRSLELKRLTSSVAHSSLVDSTVTQASTSDRVKSFQTDEDPSLVELLFQYGRYLLISSSRPGTQVANLQGIWNKDLEPVWDGAPHLNINLEMNYWPALPCNLSECQEPLFDYISLLSVNGSKTAHVNYQANGWVAHSKSDIWARTSAGQGDVVWALWPMGGAWLCTHLWEHYAYTMDEDFLKYKAYPLMEGCVSFLLSWLIEDSEGYLETNPSTSPEHYFIAPNGEPACVSQSSTMDVAIINEVFSTFLSAAEVIGRTKDNIVGEVRKAQPRLRPINIAQDGSIMEWVKDFKDPEVHHRHLSHLFGLFPGHTITFKETPALIEAAEKSLYKRGEEGPGWSTTWKTACWARLQNSSNAYKMIKHLINLVDPDHERPFQGGLYSNLFAAHPPFQIDANFGFAAAVAEMLVQSTLSDLFLLPALPWEKWPNGSLKGLKARGGTTVNIYWREGDLQEVGIWSEDQTRTTLRKRIHYRGTMVTADLVSGLFYKFNGQLKCLNTCSLSEMPCSSYLV